LEYSVFSLVYCTVDNEKLWTKKAWRTFGAQAEAD